MFRSKYSTALTVILIVLIIAIITIGIIVAVRTYKNYEDEKEKSKIYAALDTIETDGKVENKIEENDDAGDIFVLPVAEINETTQQSSSSSGGTTRRSVPMYKNYPVAGYIKISKTNVSYPILLDVSPGALDTAVGVMYPTNPTLNKPGNVVIIGHNYRNGKFFSNNKKLVVGDKIEIKDLTGTTLIYTIYEIFQTTESDTEYVTRDRGNNTEISLSTCTDDGLARLIILARVN